MLRKIDLIEDADRDVIVVETVYSNDHLVSAHTHKRVQLLHATTGIMQLDTKYGAWVVPPGFAVWIPVGIVHQVRTINAPTSSLYFKPAALVRHSGRASGGERGCLSGLIWGGAEH